MTVTDAIGQTLQPAPKAPAKPVVSSDFETFLKMLTVQLKNQDPLNPVESSDFAVQLATFSSVEQQVLTNDLLRGLSGQMGQMGMAQLASWVGMEARAAMPTYFDGFPVMIHPEPLPMADEARLVVRNAAEDVVQTLAIPLTGETYAWMGRDAAGQSLPAGVYTFEVESYVLGASQGSSPVALYARIVEARNEGGKTILVMEGGAMIDADQVTGLRNG